MRELTAGAICAEDGRSPVTVYIAMTLGQSSVPLSCARSVTECGTKPDLPGTLPLRQRAMAGRVLSSFP